MHQPARQDSGGWAADIRCARFIHSSGRLRIYGADAAQALELALRMAVFSFAHYGVRDIVVESVESNEDETAGESAVRIVINTPPVRWISGWYSGGDGPDRRVVSTVHEAKRVDKFGMAADIRCPRFIISSGMPRAFCIDRTDGLLLATRFILSMYEHLGVRDIVVSTEEPGGPDG
ncbi:MAG: hypothetical protein VW644_02880 [Alphaproteobacteria bacterium]